MSDDLLQSIANDLVALTKASGTDEHGYKQIMIPQPQDRDEALKHIEQCKYQKQMSFSFTDSRVVDKVRELHATRKRVWVMLDVAACRIDLYTPPEDHRKTARSTWTNAKTGSEADSQARILRKKKEAERRLKRA